MAVLFSTDSSNFMLNNDNNVDNSDSLSTGQLEEKYELIKCLEWIQHKDYKKIALQFPDDHLVNSYQISQWFQSKSESQFFVLADTSYGSCCIDEIAAEHVSCDALIHYGSTCLSPTTRLPVYYVLGRAHIDLENLSSECLSFRTANVGNVIIIYDVMFHYAKDEIVSKLKEVFENVIVSNLDFPPNSENSKGNNSSENSDNHILINCGRTISLPPDLSIEDFTMLYIGEESLTQANLCLSFNKNRFASYSPSGKKLIWDSVNTNRILKKRYYLVEKTKDAKIIGILVGTLGVKDYLSVISHLKSIIKVAGKRSYTIAVGKPNPAKLANFAEIDIYVLVACAENSLLDSAEFYRPIVTPFELEIALNKSREWDGRYITDFTEIIEGGKNYVKQEKWDDEEQYVSLISGHMRFLGVAKGSSEVVEVQSQALEVRNEMKLAPLHSDGAGSHLAQRSWKGLEQKLGETEVHDSIEGQRGIAASYENEPK